MSAAPDAGSEVYKLPILRPLAQPRAAAILKIAVCHIVETERIGPICTFVVRAELFKVAQVKPRHSSLVLGGFGLPAVFLAVRI